MSMNVKKVPVPVLRHGRYRIKILIVILPLLEIYYLRAIGDTVYQRPPLTENTLARLAIYVESTYQDMVDLICCSHPSLASCNDSVDLLSIFQFTGYFFQCSHLGSKPFLPWTPLQEYFRSL